MSTTAAPPKAPAPKPDAPATGNVGDVRKSGWFVRITVIVVVILWIIPTLGVLISSFRQPDAR